MNNYPLNITESKALEKLVYKKSKFTKFSDFILELPIIFVIPVLCGYGTYMKFSRTEPFIGILLLFILFLTLSGLILYSLLKINSLERVNGISSEENSKIINEIINENNWNPIMNDQQITLINFSWKETGTDWGKQMTILYDQNDILVNCKSFELFSNPSPFHWFANKKKIRKFKSKFKNNVKNVLQQRV